MLLWRMTDCSLTCGSTNPLATLASRASYSVRRRKARSSGLQFTSPHAWSAHYGATGRGSVLAIGNFDGMHLGHQAILRAVAQRAAESGAVATALTFDPPPRKVLRPESAPQRLSTNASAWNGLASGALRLRS